MDCLIEVYVRDRPEPSMDSEKDEEAKKDAKELSRDP